MTSYSDRKPRGSKRPNLLGTVPPNKEIMNVSRLLPTSPIGHGNCDRSRKKFGYVGQSPVGTAPTNNQDKLLHHTRNGIVWKIVTGKKSSRLSGEERCSTYEKLPPRFARISCEIY